MTYEEMYERLESELKNGVVLVEFYKENGDARRAIATRNPKIIDRYQPKSADKSTEQLIIEQRERKERDLHNMVIRFLDLVEAESVKSTGLDTKGKKGTPWRSFRIDRSINFRVLTTNTDMPLDDLKHLARM